MAHVTLRGEPRDLEEPYLVEGMPGVGLVGKIATDHLIEELGMDHYADVHCEGIPRIGVYGAGERGVVPPVRFYVDEQRDLLALRSDVPVSPKSAGDFASCVTGWFAEQTATPILLSGLPAEKGSEPPKLSGIATGDGGDLLSEINVSPPAESGVVSGPTGALLNEAIEQEQTVVTLIVESDPQFPDPEAARILIEQGIGELASLDVSLSDLVDRAEEIRTQKEKLAKRMQQADDEASKAQPLRMYQ